MSKLVVNVGSMFSGKTTELQRQGERHILAGHKVLFIKPSMDSRYSESEIVTHKGAKVDAISMTTTDVIQKLDLLKEYEVILIDEVQFFGSILETIIWELLRAGISVYASGLDMNYLGEGFETTRRLMAIADEVQKFHAVCEKCGNDAVSTGKRNFKEHGEIVEIGEKELYMPLCRQCFSKFMEEDS